MTAVLGSLPARALDVVGWQQLGHCPADQTLAKCGLDIPGYKLTAAPIDHTAFVALTRLCERSQIGAVPAKLVL